DEVHVAAKLVEVRPTRGERHRPGWRRAAAQRSLRPLQYFDLADVELALEHVVRLDRYFVDVHFHGWRALRRHLELDATRLRRRIETAAITGQGQAGNERRYVLKLENIEFLKVLAG